MSTLLSSKTLVLQAVVCLLTVAQKQFYRTIITICCEKQYKIYKMIRLIFI